MKKKKPLTTNERVRRYRAENPEKARESNRRAQAKYAAANPEKIMLRRTRLRAERAGIPFEINETHIEIPDVCPALGIPIVRDQGLCDGSPSIDRLQPELGYTPDNIAVISNRANRIKNNATSTELQKIAKWVDKCSLK